MRKWIILCVVIGLICLGWWYARSNVRYTPEWNQAKFGQITRGDIHVPITASGLIDADERIDIKSKASGEVIAIEVKEGDFVHKGDKLVVLKRDDEERRLAQAQAALTRAKAALTQAEEAVERARNNITVANARVDETKGNRDIIRFDLEWLEGRPAATSEKELYHMRAQERIIAAQLKTAEANVKIANNSLADAQQAVVIQGAVVADAQKAVEDTEERLRETTILAPQDAIVTDVRVSVGNLVQSATQGLTGGTPVLELADVSKLKVVTRVDESDIGRVYRISPETALPEMPDLREALEADAEAMTERSGNVMITVDAFPEDEFTGHIERVEPQGKLNAGSAIIQYDVHVEVTDERRAMLPLGTQAQVEFTVESALDTLIVPAEAVMTMADRRGIFVKTPPPAGSTDPFGHKFVECRFGITDGANTQIIEAVNSEEELTDGREIFTRLPATREEN